jgi:hypothetical protein
MLGAVVSGSTITITYNISVSCDALGTAYSNFQYDSATGTTGGSITGCSHLNSVLTLTGSGPFTAPSGTASILYTEPPSPIVSNAVYATAVPTDFEGTETLPAADIAA